MAAKGGLSFLLILIGFATISLPFTREFAFISIFLIVFGAVRLGRDLGLNERLRQLIRSNIRRSDSGTQGTTASKIDPLLPVRVLKLAEARAGVLTVSAVAMALNVGLDECQIALDELVRKGAASVDVDLATGVASYLFPEFLPHTIEGAGTL